MKVPADPVKRNLLGVELEREGKIENAIECYEANVRDGCMGNHPYDRLVVLYRKRKDSASEIARPKAGCRGVRAISANISENGCASETG